MTTFRERISKAMESYRHLQVPEGDHTLGALVSSILGIHDEAEAMEFWEGYVAWQQHYPHETLTAEQVCQSNIGWCFGENMSPEDKAMWVRVCNASHPIFGQANTTSEEAFRAGVTLGKRSTSNRRGP